MGLALIGLVMSACGVGSQDPADIPPPEIRANGVAGTVVSYCRALDYCADGGVSLPPDLPDVQLPVTLTFEEPIGHVTAAVSATGQEDQPVTLIGATAEGSPLGATIRIQEWPDGEWKWLIVSAGFPEEVSVSAAWDLAGS